MMKRKLFLTFVFLAFLGLRFCEAQAADTKTAPATKVDPFPAYSVEKNPLVITKPNGERFTFLRTGKSTCGKYVLAVVDVPSGSGPPPHIHYASEEWFYLYEGAVTLYMQEDNRVFHAGQRPGENVPAETLRAFPLHQGQLAYGPLGMIHAFTNENKETVHRFINLWAPGDGMVEFMQEMEAAMKANPNMSPEEQTKLLQTVSAKWGVPHDPTGTFARETHQGDMPENMDAQAKRLEELIRSTESCNPDR